MVVLAFGGLPASSLGGRRQRCEDIGDPPDRSQSMDYDDGYDDGYDDDDDEAERQANLEKALDRQAGFAQRLIERCQAPLRDAGIALCTPEPTCCRSCTVFDTPADDGAYVWVFQSNDPVDGNPGLSADRMYLYHDHGTMNWTKFRGTVMQVLAAAGYTSIESSTPAKAISFSET